jgi:hypothetical protein
LRQKIIRGNIVVKINLAVCAFLVCVVFFAGCAGGAKPAEEGGEDDVWGVCESAEELKGEWEGSLVLAVPANESKGLPATVFNISLSLRCADQRAAGRVKIAFGAFLADLLAAHPESALTSDDLWETYFENAYAGYDLAGEEYALVIEYSYPAEDLIDDKIDETSRLYINQDGTRLRKFARGGLLGALLEPFGVSGDVELVLDRL